MPKQKPPRAPKMWSHMTESGDWEIHLPDGQTLRRLEDLELGAAQKRANSGMVIWIAYGIPARDLSGDVAALAEELVPPKQKRFEHNTFHLFGSTEGARALVVEFHH
jgi:hypothetical protein